MKKEVNKNGALTDLFLMIIFTFIILLIAGIFIYIGVNVRDKFQEEFLDTRLSENINSTVLVNNTMGKVSNSYNLFYWIATFIFIGLVLSIFVGCYLVTTKPFFFIPYSFIVIIAIIVSVPLSNSYERILNDEVIGNTFAGFSGMNYIMLNLPIVIAIVGFIGGVIMFARLGSKESEVYSEAGYYE